MSSDIEILRLFCLRAVYLREWLALNNTKIKVTIEYIKNHGQPQMEYEGPNKESIIAMVSILRQFYLQKETINFYKVYKKVNKILYSSKASDKDKKMDFIKSLRVAFVNSLSKSQINIAINNKSIKPRELMEIWFNGNIFHSSIEQSKKFELLMNSPISIFAEFVFKVTIINLANIIIVFADFINKDILKTV